MQDCNNSSKNLKFVKQFQKENRDGKYFFLEKSPGLFWFYGGKVFREKYRAFHYFQRDLILCKLQKDSQNSAECENLVSS